MENAGDAERNGAQRGALNDKHSEGHTDKNGNHHGNNHERKVIERGAEDFVAMIQEEGPSGLRIHARAPGVTAREAVKARTSG